MTLEITLATNNPKKASELDRLLGDLEVRVRPAGTLDDPPKPEETGTTFIENARIKAVAFQEATGGWALADDSGLEVDALDGRPGVYSSRFAGREGDDAANNQLLIESLAEVDDAERTARFRCVLCLRGPDGEEHLSEGSIEGVIGRERRGSEGFGYDPLFLIPSEDKTFAELGADYKSLHSHRARALAGMKETIRSIVERLSRH